jgi:flagellar motor switch protein FliG
VSASFAGRAAPKAGKAAMLLATLESELAINVLKKLDPHEVKMLLASAEEIGSVDADEVDPVIDEFELEFSSEPGIDAGSEQMLALLGKAYDADRMAAVLGHPVARKRENVWQKLTPGIETALVPYLLDQHEQVSAYVLSKLQPELAAKCMAMFPRTQKARLARRLLKIVEPLQQSVECLEDALLEDLFGKTETKPSQGKGILAAMINRLDRPQTVEMLEDLSASNASDMLELRKMIFMFEDLPQLKQNFRVKLMDRVPAELVIAALFGMDETFRAAILEAMSARSRRMVESELQGDTAEPRKDTAAARRKIAETAMQMAQKGEIELPNPDEKDETPGAVVAA